MAEIRYNNGKYVFGESEFRVTNDEVDSTKHYREMSHDGDDGIFGIGSGSDKNNYTLPIVLSDDGYFDLPAGSAGYGYILVGDSEEWVRFTWDGDNYVNLLGNSTNVDDADTDGTLAIFDNTSAVRVRNRLGTSKRIMFEYFYTENSLPWTFRAFSAPSGVDNLDPSLTINSATATPTFRYKGGDANATNLVPWTYGETLDRVVVGVAPSYNDGSPGLGLNDDSVKFNESDYYKSAAITQTLSTGDIAFEVVLKIGDTGADQWLMYFYTTNGLSLIYDNANSKLSLNINDAGGGLSVSSADNSAPDDTWIHAICFMNRDEDSDDGAWWYINGVASGAGGNVSTISGDISSSTLTIGSSNGTNNGASTIAYMAVWEYADWHQAGAAGPAEWATVAAERFAKFSGIYPQLANDSYMPTTMERTYPAYLDKVEDGYRKLYYVGSEWLRMCHRQSSIGENIRGFLSEIEAENLITYSEGFSNWSKYDAGDVVADNAILCPDGRVAASSIVADSTDGLHSVYTTATLTADTYTFSVFAKPGNNNWVQLRNSTANAHCYFDVSNGVIGTTANCAGYLEGPFYGGFYRCAIVHTGTAASHTLRIRSCIADNDSDFPGNGVTVNTYLWGAQCELGDYMTSPIRTSGSSASRLFDDLEYVANGNIGDTDAGEGTIMFDYLYASYAMADPGYAFYITDGGSNDDSVLGAINNTGEKPTVYIIETANPPDVIDGPAVETADGLIHEVRCDWGASTTVYTDGVAGTPVTGITSPDELDQMQIGSLGSSDYGFNGIIQDFRVRGPSGGPR